MRLVLFAHVIVALLSTINAERYYIYSEASDSFGVNIESDNSNCEIVPLFVTPEIDPLKICGRIEQPFGPFSNRREKNYNVTFKDGYVPVPGEEPYISFCNEIGEFQIVFLNEKHINLRSNSLLETHDDAGRRDTDLKCCAYEGLVRHWLFFGPYLVIYSHDCYGTFRSPTKSIYICDAPQDKLWVQSFRERDCETYVKIILQSIPTANKPTTRTKSRVRDFFSKTDIPSCSAQREHWWSKIFCCDDPDAE